MFYKKTLTLKSQKYPSIAIDEITVLVLGQSPTLWSVIKPFLGWAFLSSIILIHLCYSL
jgi:hypothetical protein